MHSPPREGGLGGLGHPPGLLNRTNALSKSSKEVEGPIQTHRRCPLREPVWRPPEPPEREPPSQARPPPLPPVAAFPHPVLHACGAHPTDPPSRGYDRRPQDAPALRACPMA